MLFIEENQSKTNHESLNDTTLDVVEEGGSGGSGKVFLRHGSSDHHHHHHTNGNGKTPHNGNGNSNGNGPIGFGKDMVSIHKAGFCYTDIC